MKDFLDIAEMEYALSSREFDKSLVEYNNEKTQELRKFRKKIKQRADNGFRNLSLQEQEEEFRNIRPTIEQIVGLDLEDCKHKGMAHELAQEAFESLTRVYSHFFDYNFIYYSMY